MVQIQVAGKEKGGKVRRYKKQRRQASVRRSLLFSLKAVKRNMEFTSVLPQGFCGWWRGILGNSIMVICDSQEIGFLQIEGSYLGVLLKDAGHQV